MPWGAPVGKVEENCPKAYAFPSICEAYTFLYEAVCLEAQEVYASTSWAIIDSFDFH